LQIVDKNGKPCSTETYIHEVVLGKEEGSNAKTKSKNATRKAIKN